MLGDTNPLYEKKEKFESMEKKKKSQTSGDFELIQFSNLGHFKH